MKFLSLSYRGSNPGGREFFRTRPEWPWSPPSLLYNGDRVFLGGQSGRGVALTTHPHLAPRLRKEPSYTFTPLWAFVACPRVKFNFTFTFVAVIYCSNEMREREREREIAKSLKRSRPY
jgi:hypothetical protein